MERVKTTGYIHRQTPEFISRESSATPKHPDTISYAHRPSLFALSDRDVSAYLTRPLPVSFKRLPQNLTPRPVETQTYLLPDPKLAGDKRKMALLLPGHNEELIIATTIRSAVAAGQALEDIYVVDDASTDNTAAIARILLGKDHVLSVDRSGKAVAVKKGIAQFGIEESYEWLHVADADSVFSSNYFEVYREKLSDKYAVAIGFVQSLRGNWISTYRAISYTYGQQVWRRLQAWLGMVSVFPGPVTSFRTDILSDLDINPNNVAEDFDMTLQVHRKQLGRVLYIPGAVNYTQDPQTFRDFRKQSMRWYRGFFQGVQQHRIGTKRQKIDVSIGFQLVQTAIFLFQILVLFPIILWQTHDWMIAPLAIMIDFVITGFITIGASILLKRWYLLGAMPYFYFLRVAEIVMYFTAFVDVFLLKRVNNTVKGWATEGRRYKIDQSALKDVTT